MFLYINNNGKEFNDSETIISVLNSLEIKQQKGIAVAINNNIVLKKDWDSFELKHNDRITVIKASQGG